MYCGQASSGPHQAELQGDLVVDAHGPPNGRTEELPQATVALIEDDPFPAQVISEGGTGCEQLRQPPGGVVLEGQAPPPQVRGKGSQQGAGRDAGYGAHDQHVNVAIRIATPPGYRPE